MQQASRRIHTAPPAHPFHKQQCQTAFRFSLLADHFVVVGSAVSGGGFLFPPVHHVNTFFSVFLPPSFRPIGGEKKRTRDRSQVLGNRVSASLMKGI
jgi:hypothetical protein